MAVVFYTVLVTQPMDIIISKILKDSCQTDRWHEQLRVKTETDQDVDKCKCQQIYNLSEIYI